MQALFYGDTQVGMLLTVITFAIMYFAVKVINHLETLRKLQDVSEDGKLVVAHVLNETKNKRITRIKDFLGL